ncbi:MAG: anaerobic ribonucleoside-triphosphate reductase activating protein [Oscillospiraceae bacterium]
MKLNIAGTVCESLVDGPGLRYVVFVQGCPHRCEGCHNPETHSFSGGKAVDIEQLFSECMEDPLHKGVTFSGGEPFCQSEGLYALALMFKERGLHLMCYSGWTFEELLAKSKTEEYVGKLLSVIDILVDGRFIPEERSLALSFRGSKNQRLIDVPKSLSENKVITIDL